MRPRRARPRRSRAGAHRSRGRGAAGRGTAGRPEATGSRSWARLRAAAGMALPPGAPPGCLLGCGQDAQLLSPWDRGGILGGRHWEPSPSGRGLETAQVTGKRKAVLPQADLSFSQLGSAPWLLPLKKKVNGILRLEPAPGVIYQSVWGKTGNLTTLNLSVHGYPALSPFNRFNNSQ